jgi:integrase
MDGRRRSSSRELPGSARLVLARGAVFLRPEEAVFEAMLEGWTAQMRSRSLVPTSIGQRVRTVRRFAGYTNEWPWEWGPRDLEEWSGELLSGERPLAHTTLRNYQGAIRMFLDYATDARYGWARECEERFGRRPAQVCTEWNVATHTNGYEGSAEVRPFAREELQGFLDFCDEKAVEARRLGRKGWLAAFRDATLFKTIYAWGLRRREAAKLELTDFWKNAEFPEFGRYGTLLVRYGKASKGGVPRRRNVLTVMPWAVEVLEEYVSEIRPLYGPAAGNALWPTERGMSVSAHHVSRRFAEYRDELGLPEEMHPHCLRHSYVTHLLEDGHDQLFVQQQVGHRWGSTTALYTGVSGDFKNRVLRAALDGIFGPIGGGREG